MWCKATQLYIFIALIKIIFILFLHPHLPELSNEQKYQYMSLYLGVLITWFLILAWLCSTCNQNIALAVLLIPFIICFLFSITIFTLIRRFHNQII